MAPVVVTGRVDKVRKQTIEHYFEADAVLEAKPHRDMNHGFVQFTRRSRLEYKKDFPRELVHPPTLSSDGGVYYLNDAAVDVPGKRAGTRREHFRDWLRNAPAGTDVRIIAAAQKEGKYRGQLRVESFYFLDDTNPHPPRGWIKETTTGYAKVTVDAAGLAALYPQQSERRQFRDQITPRDYVLYANAEVGDVVVCTCIRERNVRCRDKWRVTTVVKKKTQIDYKVVLGCGSGWQTSALLTAKAGELLEKHSAESFQLSAAMWHACHPDCERPKKRAKQELAAAAPVVYTMPSGCDGVDIKMDVTTGRVQWNDLRAEATLLGVPPPGDYKKLMLVLAQHADGRAEYVECDWDDDIKTVADNMREFFKSKTVVMRVIDGRQADRLVDQGRTLAKKYLDWGQDQISKSPSPATVDSVAVKTEAPADCDYDAEVAKIVHVPCPMKGCPCMFYSQFAAAKHVYQHCRVALIPPNRGRICMYCGIAKQEGVHDDRFCDHTNLNSKNPCEALAALQ